MKSALIVQQMAKAFAYGGSPTLLIAGHRFEVTAIHELLLPGDPLQKDLLLKPLNDAVRLVPGRDVAIDHHHEPYIHLVGLVKIDDAADDMGIDIAINPSDIQAIYFETNLS